MPVVLYKDPLAPVLFNSEPLKVSVEQIEAIRDVLKITSSDSKFAEKAFAAITKILTGGSAVVPSVTSLTPNSVVLGSPSFDIHVHGNHFTEDTVIIFAGYEEPTTYISPTEVKTGVDMSVWLGPDVVAVGTVSGDGIPSNTLPFRFELVASTTSTHHQSIPPIKATQIPYNPVQANPPGSNPPPQTAKK